MKKEWKDFFVKIVREVSKSIFKNIKTYLFLWILLILFVIYYLIEGYRQILLGLIFVSMGLHFFKSIKRPLNILGLFVVAFGAIFLIIQIDYTLGLIGAVLLLFSILFSHYFLIKSKDIISRILGLFIVLIMFLVAMRIIFPAITDLLNFVFSRNNPSVSQWFFLLLVLLLIPFAIFSMIKYIVFLLGKIKNFKKIDNTYFVVSLTIIFLVLSVGFWGVKEFYINDYPLGIQSPINVITEKPFECYSNQGKVYFLDRDFVYCDGKIHTINNLTFKKPEMKIIFIEGHPENYSSFIYNLEEERKIISRFGFEINKSINKYMLFVSSKDLDGKTIYNQNIEIFLDGILTKDEYNSLIRERIGFLAGVFLISVFSVFSAIANLKKILEEKK